MDDLERLLWRRKGVFPAIVRHHIKLSDRYDGIILLRNDMIKWCDDYLIDVGNIKLKKEDFEKQSLSVLHLKTIINKSMDDINSCFLTPQHIKNDVKWLFDSLTSVDPDICEEWDRKADELGKRRLLLEDLFLVFSQVNTMFKEMVAESRHQQILKCRDF